MGAEERAALIAKMRNAPNLTHVEMRLTDALEAAGEKIAALTVALKDEEAAAALARIERDEIFDEIKDWKWKYDEAKKRLAQAEAALSRAVFLAEHLWQMIPQGVWREHGAEWQGQYEGDYWAERVRDELRELAALSSSLRKLAALSSSA